MKKMVICGLGYISHRVANGCMHAKNMELYGFLSSDENKALSYKEKYQAKKIYTSYEHCLNDPEVDVIYLATPNHVHYEQIMNCLKHHKHVICEKPMVATEKEIKELFAYARKQQCLLMEAEKTLFSPLLIKLKEIIDSGKIGDVYHIQAEYNYDIRKQNYPDTHWVFQKNGGCALDIGVYPICFTHFFANSKISTTQSIKRTYKDYKVEFYFQSLIKYENNITADIKCDWLQDFPLRGMGIVYGTKGYIEVPHFWKENKATIITDKVEHIEVEMLSDFTGEIEHFASCLEQGYIESPYLNEEMSLEILKAMK